jgi:hypothetical protein
VRIAGTQFPERGEMANLFGRIVIFLLGALVGYCSGFKDAQNHDVTVFERVVRRVENFGERTVGDRQREVEEAAQEAGK